MHLSAPAIVLTVRAHGEHGAVVRAMTEGAGVLPGYVRGGRSTRLRPVLQPANAITGEWRARTDAQLPALTVELVHSRAPLFEEPLAAAALEWVTGLTALALPEGQPYPRLHAALNGVIGAIEAAPAARGWAVALVRYELLVLAELGFGLDLSQCVATGDRDELAFVSPRSGGAVSRAAATGHEARLFALPPFLLTGGAAGWPDILDGLKLTGHFLARDVLTDRRADVLAGRERLVERIKRAAG
ncbi:DNA repair protein RecO [Sphingomonas sp. SFZ2018-12]|uniref:DNA repair protein RecO n=1 Tax=Sphingomonas sp. SFZ2018-12 TaxID=2683197 RepID=UPI001F106798|nr:DNA repair protein RecO [Sphingomonas sp. SFZ2018-12]MCH4892180.1 DNA repair protein RecO [Sphingomonas sp. SFZ2018-12]